MLLQEEEEREREMKQLEVARYQQEMKLAQREAEEEKIRRKQAYLKWVHSQTLQECMDACALHICHLLPSIDGT